MQESKPKKKVKYFVSVINKWFRNDLGKEDKFSNDDLLIFALLQKNMLIRKDTMLFNLDWIYKQLKIGSKSYDQMIKIKESLINLTQNNILFYEYDDYTYTDIKNDTDLIMKLDKGKLVTTYMEIDSSYTQILIDDFDKILSLDKTREYKRNIFALYCNIASRVGNKKYCYPSELTLSKDINLSSKTNIVVDYLKMLKKIGLIDYDNAGTIYQDNYSVQSNNVYVLCNTEGYKKILSDEITKRQKEYIDKKFKISNKELSNIKRSISMVNYHKSKNKSKAY